VVGGAPPRCIRVSAQRILITGSAGLVGTGLLASRPPDAEVVAGIHRAAVDDRSTAGPVETVRVDLTDPDAVDAVVADVAPDLVLHAAYDKTRSGVVDASANVAAACQATDAAVIHLSSDVVFDGRADQNSEGDRPDPVSEYGTWKLEAEGAVRARVPDAAIVRTSLVASADPPDHVMRWLAEAVSEGREVVLFDDEIRAPILLADLASAIWAIAELPRADRGGVWHLVGPEALSRLAHGRIELGWLGRSDAPVTVGSAADLADPRPRRLVLTCERAERELSFAPRSLGTVSAHGPSS